MSAILDLNAVIEIKHASEKELKEIRKQIVSTLENMSFGHIQEDIGCKILHVDIKRNA